MVWLSEEPMVVALPKRHSAASQQEIDLAVLKDDPFLLFPREVAPTIYDTVIDACRKAGFEPTIGQVAPHFTSIVNLVAAELGVSIVPASMTQVRVTGIGSAPDASLHVTCVPSQGQIELTVATVGISLAIAALSYYLLERPILRFK